MYDCTFYVENDFDVSIAHWLKGNPSTITLVCSRIDLSDIPTDPDESKAYLNQLFHEKVPSNACRPGLQGLDRELLVSPLDSHTLKLRPITKQRMNYF